MNSNTSHRNRILITGGAGFIGSHVVDCLATNPLNSLLIIDNLTTGSIENITHWKSAPNVRFEINDILDETSTDRLIAEFLPTAIIHLAALVSVEGASRSPLECFKLNVEASYQLAITAVKYATSRFVFASSAAIYGANTASPLSEFELPSPISIYGASKSSVEQLLKAIGLESGITTCSLRFFNVYGPRQRPDSPYSGVISIFNERISHAKPLTIFGDGTQTRDFVSVSDVARIVSETATNEQMPSGEFNVCTGKATSINELVSVLEHIYRTNANITYKPIRNNDIMHSLGSPLQLTRHLALQSNLTLFNGLQQMVKQ